MLKAPVFRISGVDLGLVGASGFMARGLELKLWVAGMGVLLDSRPIR